MCNLLLSIVLLTALTTVKCQDCGGSVGAAAPATDDTGVDAVPSQAFLMEDTVFHIDCCGIVESYEVNVENYAGSPDLVMQIWEQTTTADYTLVGQNFHTLTADGYTPIPIATADKISVRNPSYVGWWTSGPEVITYKAAGASGRDKNKKQTLGALNVDGTSTNWAVPFEENKDYAVKVNLAPSTVPEFTNLPSTVSDSISVAQGTSLFTVAYTDDDVYDIPDLSIVMVPAVSADFEFDTTTKIVTTKQTFAGATITRELVFEVSDPCGKTATATLTISLINLPPVINSVPAAYNISEDQFDEAPIMVLDASDPDSSFTCSLQSTAPAGGPFNVRLQAGSSSYELINTYNPSFNYDAISTYTLTVACEDDEHTTTGTVYVYVSKNQAPTFVNLQNSVVISSSAGIGSTIFTVICNDIENDTLSYRMQCDPDTCLYDIVDSGLIYVTALHTSSTVGYDIDVWCSDGRTETGPSRLTVTYSDLNNDVILNNLPNAAVIPENSAVGSNVFNVTFTDQDAGQTHTFYMTSTSAEAMSLFTINPTTGEITTSNPLDFETLTSTSFTFDVTVSDPVVSDTKQITITVTDVNEAPSFSQASYSLSTVEGAANTIIGSPPFGITDPENDATSVTLDCGTETQYFTLDGSLNVLYQSNYDLDAGSLPTAVTCTLNVTDSGGLYDTCTLYISIDAINDNTPAFSSDAYFFHVSYYAAVGSTLGTLTATDGDIAPHGTLTFQLDQSSLTTQYFSLDNNGDLRVINSLVGNSDMGFSTSRTFTATVSDGTNTDTATVTITISDTTTTSTTTTTDYYLKFFDDKKNIAWFTICIILLTCCMGFLGYILLTCNGTGNIFRGRRVRKFEFRDPPEDWVVKKTTQMVSARNPPPPVTHQQWRTGGSS